MSRVEEQRGVLDPFIVVGIVFIISCFVVVVLFLVDLVVSSGDICCRIISEPKKKVDLLVE